MQPGETFPVALAQVDHLRALDQAPRLKINALLAVFQRFERKRNGLAQWRAQLSSGPLLGLSSGLPLSSRRRTGIELGVSTFSCLAVCVGI